MFEVLWRSWARQVTAAMVWAGMSVNSWRRGISKEGLRMYAICWEKGECGWHEKKGETQMQRFDHHRAWVEQFLGSVEEGAIRLHTISYPILCFFEERRWVKTFLTFTCGFVRTWRWTTSCGKRSFVGVGGIDSANESGWTKMWSTGRKANTGVWSGWISSQSALDLRMKTCWIMCYACRPVQASTLLFLFIPKECRQDRLFESLHIFIRWTECLRAPVRKEQHQGSMMRWTLRKEVMEEKSEQRGKFCCTWKCICAFALWKRWITEQLFCLWIWTKFYESAVKH